MKSNKKTDVLDYVYLYGLEFIREIEGKGLTITPDIMIEVIKKAIESVREHKPDTVYIRKLRNIREKRQAFALWESLKHGDMRMIEIYKYISEQTDVPENTVISWVNDFRKGYDPNVIEWPDVK